LGLQISINKPPRISGRALIKDPVILDKTPIFGKLSHTINISTRSQESPMARKKQVVLKTLDEKTLIELAITFGFAGLSALKRFTHFYDLYGKYPDEMRRILEKLLPVNETVWEAVWSHEGSFTKQDIIDKLRVMGVCPHPIAASTVKTIISTMSGEYLEMVHGGVGSLDAEYRNKVDPRLRQILRDIWLLERQVKKKIKAQKILRDIKVLEKRVKKLIQEQSASTQPDAYDR
jgi:hypothetical protein